MGFPGNDWLLNKGINMKKILFTICISSLIAIALFFYKPAYFENTVNLNAKEAAGQFPIPSYANVFSTEAEFQDAKDDLLEAIEENGLVISYTSHAKTMLANTAEVSGVTEAVYKDAEILLFCKADLSHKLVAGNPHNIVLCPYSIAIYVLTAEPERVYLSYRKVATSDEDVIKLTKPIEELLIKIIEEVI